LSRGSNCERKDGPGGETIGGESPAGAVQNKFGARRFYRKRLQARRHGGPGGRCRKVKFVLSASGYGNAPIRETRLKECVFESAAKPQAP
jgi:hypothetical protein